MTSPDPKALERDAKGRPTYAHRPKLVGAAIAFTLEPGHLAWSDGKVEGRIPLHQVESVRILYRPANLATQRYRVEVRQRLGRAVWFANLSYRGLMEVETRDAAFSAFVRALLPAIARAAPKARFLGGEPPWRYGLVAAVSGLLALAAVVVAWEAARTLSLALGGAVVLVIAYMAWQMAVWLAKNRPVEVDPAAPPAALMPAGTKPVSIKEPAGG